MATPQKTTDKYVQRIRRVLQDGYHSEHQKAQIEVYRYNPASIRIRIIDSDFERKDLVEREEMVWPLLESLPEDIRAEITMLVLVTPKEGKTSFLSMEFEDPTPSEL